MAEAANRDRDVTITLQALLQTYDAEGGSNTFNMTVLRNSFAQTIPYSDSNFHRDFSIFATEAVARDLKANRFVYPIGGQLPDPSIPIKDTDPYIFPIHLLQNIRNSNTSNSREGDGREQRRQEAAQQGNISAERQRAAEGNEEGKSARREEAREGGERGERKDKRPFEVMKRSSSEDSCQDTTVKNRASHVFSFIKNSKQDDRTLSLEAQKISALVMEYITNDLNKAVLDFCWKAGKHHDFPDALVRDLLQYKF
ncbi:hypothetical protein DFH28DRAFT_1017091, partial [Melampsora americana]